MPRPGAAREDSHLPSNPRTELAALRLQSAALAAASNSIVITDREGAIVWVNPAFTALTGYSFSEAIGRNPRDLVKSGQHERAVFKNLWETILAGGVWHGELVNRRKDGSLYSEDQTITPVRDSTGAVTHFIAVKQDTTFQKQTNEALRIAHERLTQLLDHSPAVLYVLRLEGHVGMPTLVSENVATLLGFTVEEAMSREWWINGLHPDDRTAAMNSTRETIEAGTSHTEYRMRHRNGSYRWISDYRRLVRGADGNPLELVGVWTDISERKQAELALEDSLSILRATLESTKDGILVVNEVGKILLSNQKFVEMWRLAPDMMAAREDGPLLACITEQLADPASFLAKVRELYLHPEVVSFDILELKDGRTFERHSQARTIAGAGVGRVWSFRDITASRLAEQHLREQNEILSKSHEAIIIVGLDGKVSYWNHGAEVIFGWTAAEALGRPPTELTGLDEPDKMLAIRAAVAEKGFWSGELRSHPRDGRKCILAASITLVRDEAGRPRTRLSILSDITEKKQLEEQALRSQRLENLGALAAGIAHDFNNALAPIVMAGPLLQKMVGDPAAQRILKIVDISSARGAALVRQMLSFARGTFGEKQITQIIQVLREVLDLSKSTFPKSIRIQANLQDGLWPVLGDSTQMHQVFLNLCVNARDAMPGGGRLTVAAENRTLDAAQARKIEGGRAGRFLAVEVRDTGTGIPQEVLGKIFEPFFTTKGEGKGTGLGLSTVRSIVHQHDGFMAVDTSSAKGRGHGTAFTIYLPAMTGDAVGPSRIQGALPLRGRDELILFVDDEGPVRELGSKILVQHGYQVITAVDGADAVASFMPRAREVQLLLTDLDMPRVNGTQLALALREMHPRLPVIAMSGTVNQSDEGIAKFASALLPKPFEAQTLLEIVRRTLDRAGSAGPFQTKI